MVHSVICTNNKDQKFSVKLNEVLNEHMVDTDSSVDDFAELMGLGRTVFSKESAGCDRILSQRIFACHSVEESCGNVVDRRSHRCRRSPIK